MTTYSIHHEAEIPPEAREQVLDGLRAHNRRHAPDPHFVQLYLLLRAPDGSIHGGLLAESGWEWLHVQVLWVTDELRGQGFGHALLVRAEEEARATGCRGVHLDTHDFQAPAFYEKEGYRLFGALDDYPLGFKRYFFAKNFPTEPSEPDIAREHPANIP